MSRTLSWFAILLLFTGCVALHTNTVPKTGDEQVPASEVSRIILTYSQKLKYQKNLELDDSVLFYEDKINRIRLDFSTLEIFDIWEARALLVDLVEEFISRINENDQLYSHLRTTPFSADDLEVYIKFESFYNKYTDGYKVGLVTLRQGIVNIIAGDYQLCDKDCWHKRSEYYFQTKNFITFKRQGEALYAPPKVTEDKSVFGDERYFSPKETPDHKNGQGTARSVMIGL